MLNSILICSEIIFVFVILLQFNYSLCNNEDRSKDLFILIYKLIVIFVCLCNIAQITYLAIKRNWFYFSVFVALDFLYIISLISIEKIEKLRISNSVFHKQSIENYNSLQALSKLFVSIHLFDLEADKQRMVFSNPQIERFVYPQDNAHEQIRKVMQGVSVPECRESILKFVDTYTLKERMKDINFLSQEFIGINQGYCISNFIAVNRNSKGEVTKVIHAVQNINSVKMQEKNHKLIEEQLLELSETDPLTGILNRKSGEFRINDFINSGNEGLFCLLDVNKFKLVNDTYGHRVGDIVLLSIVACMKQTLRENDILMRLGGDEFVFFAKGINNLTAAENLINRFFDNINKFKIEEMDNENVTVSLGATIVTENHLRNFDKLYIVSDRAMYKCKSSNSNVFLFAD